MWLNVPKTRLSTYLDEFWRIQLLLPLNSGEVSYVWRSQPPKLAQHYLSSEIVSNVAR